MTQQELDALKALADVATPDRWEIWSAATGADYIVRVPRGKNYYAVIATDCTYSNAAFIAAARSAVPALLDEVERLRGELAAAQGTIANLRTIWRNGGASDRTMARLAEAFHAYDAALAEQRAQS